MVLVLTQFLDPDYVFIRLIKCVFSYFSLEEGIDYNRLLRNYEVESFRIYNERKARYVIVLLTETLDYNCPLRSFIEVELISKDCT